MVLGNRKNSVRNFFVVVATSLMLLGVSRAQSVSGVDDIVLPDGFAIETWADGVPNARSLALGSNGTVFVSSRRDGRVYALVPGADGRPEVMVIAADLKVPNGLAFLNGDLYVAEMTRITRYPDIENNLADIPEPELIYDNLPGESQHGWRYIGFGPDDRLYISIGMPCNVCVREGFGNISRLNQQGDGLEIVADGVRNSVGFTWHPQTAELWFTDNGRDMLGDDIPPGELNHAVRDGMHFGFPYCHGSDIKDPEFGSKRSCGEFTAPAQELGPHVAPLGVKFYTGNMFPDEYRGQIFIAEHGSWNRSRKNGYRISLVRMVDGKAAGYEVFAEGWQIDDKVSGRPVDLLVMPDGSMLVSDDKAGKVYRISYRRPITEGIAQQGDRSLWETT